MRTDPSESFLNEETNIELLIDIIMVYTLEHKANIKYTQVSYINVTIIHAYAHNVL